MKDPWYCIVSPRHIHARANEPDSPNWCRYCLADMPTQTTPTPSPLQREAPISDNQLSVEKHPEQEKSISRGSPQ